EVTVTFLGNAYENVDEKIKELEKYDQAIYTTSINNIDKESAKKIDEADLPLHVYQVNSADLYTEATDLEPRLMETDVIVPGGANELQTDRKSTRLNSSHVSISYAVFCLKKKKEKKERGNN